PRIVMVDGKAQRRSRDWVGRAAVVSFSPDDLFLVKGEPSQRRRALNALLCQVDGDYYEALARYTKVVAERNAALRAVGQGNLGRGDLIPWTLSLVKEGAALTL